MSGQAADLELDAAMLLLDFCKFGDFISATKELASTASSAATKMANLTGEELMRRVDMSSEHAQGAFAGGKFDDAVNAFDMARSLLDEGTQARENANVSELRRELRLNCAMAALYAGEFRRAELEASKVLDACVDEDDAEAFLRRALARARLGSFRRAASDVTAGLACCVPGDVAWAGLEHLKARLPKLAADDARRMQKRGVVAEPRTAAVVRSSDAVMDKIMTTIHNDDELRVLCQSEGARAFVEAVDRDAHALFDPEQMGYMLEDEDARSLYAKLQARHALPTEPPPLPTQEEYDRELSREEDRKKRKKGAPPALESAPAYEPAEAAKLATLAGASPKHAKWLEANAAGLSKLAIRGDGGDALAKALGKVGLTARRYRELLFAYFRGSRKFDPKWFDEAAKQKPLDMANAFGKDDAKEKKAKKRAPWIAAPYPTYVSAAQVRRETAELARELKEVTPVLPSSLNAQPPLNLLQTFPLCDTAKSLVDATPIGAVGVNVNVCCVVVACLEAAGGKHAVCCVRGGDAGQEADADWAYPDVGAALLDAARGDAQILEDPRCAFYVFLGHLHRVKDASVSRFAADIFQRPSRSLWATLHALKRCGALARARLISGTLRQNERVGASHRGVFRVVDQSLSHLARSDGDDDARNEKLERCTRLAPVSTRVFQSPPGVDHDGPEWENVKKKFWKLAEAWIYDAPRDDAWWRHLERAVVIRLHEHPSGDVEALAIAVDRILDEADADYPKTWWDVAVPPDFDEDVLLPVDPDPAEDNPEIHYRDFDDADLEVEELDPKTADPKASYTTLPDGRKIDEDGYLVED